MTAGRFLYHVLTTQQVKFFFARCAAQEPLTDGVADQMIWQLGRLPQRIGVIARTSAMRHKRTNEDVHHNPTQSPLAKASLQAKNRARHLLLSGTPSLVVTLWEVGDLPTSQLMRASYAGLKESGNKAEGFRPAQMKMLDVSPNPRDWAAFQLTGEAHWSRSSLRLAPRQPCIMARAMAIRGESLSLFGWVSSVDAQSKPYQCTLTIFTFLAICNRDAVYA